LGSVSATAVNGLPAYALPMADLREWCRADELLSAGSPCPLNGLQLDSSDELCSTFATRLLAARCMPCSLQRTAWSPLAASVVAGM